MSVPNMEQLRTSGADYTEMSWQERRQVREMYGELQGGKCHHCRAPLDGPPTKSVLGTPVTPHLFPEKFFTHPVHLHHCHESGMTIGAVHARCNAVLWEHRGE